MGLRLIISGGGTGGHVYPAIAVAQHLREHHPDTEILFVGAEGKIEMDKVPKAGFKIEALNIRGFARKLSFENFKNIFRLFRSIRKANKIVRGFKPNMAVGFGGYASGPTLYVCQRQGVPTILQEQNSYPGITNKFLAKRAKKICVAYFGLDRFFGKEKIVLSGNPVRQDIWQNKNKRKEAYAHFGLDPNKKTILLIGGSLGARTLNQTIRDGFEIFNDEPNVQLLWQMGKLYETDYADCEAAQHDRIFPTTFIDRMDLAYLAADVIISRAGALSISELALVQKPCILVPSPNVAEDHQTKNARALVVKNAAILVPDHKSKEELLPTCIALLKNKKEQEQMSQNLKEFGMPNATSLIVDEILKHWHGA